MLIGCAVLMNLILVLISQIKVFTIYCYANLAWCQAFEVSLETYHWFGHPSSETNGKSFSCTRKGYI